MHNLSKTAALRIAREHVNLTPMGQGWTIYQPHDWDNLRGPSTGGHEQDWHVARNRYAAAVAYGTLRLMALDSAAAEEAVHNARERGCTTITEIIDYAAERGII